MMASVGAATCRAGVPVGERARTSGQEAAAAKAEAEVETAAAAAAAAAPAEAEAEADKRRRGKATPVLLMECTRRARNLTCIS